ncbi:hypothetical protein [Streptosporangium jomthongense]|uniref:Galactosyltransferase C-terminal domain-containing protein n=1 Tax=Streptosporangium jomthongense TaxID=1193683 RepID=A0ABV8FGB4_9ACTN
MTTDPTVMIVIPWRPTADRQYAYDLTVAHYQALLPDAMLLAVDTDHEPFCLAGCRNKGVRLAQDARADVVILGDADTLPEQEPLLAAIHGATTSGLVHLPYTSYRSLRRDGTAQYRRGVPLQDCNHFEVPGACSGVYVTTPATWWAHGGQDELFLGWGGEDAAWSAAHLTLLGAEPVRHNGRVYALHHASAVKEGEQYSANFARIYRYHQAQGDPDATWALLREGEAANAEQPVAGTQQASVTP